MNFFIFHLEILELFFGCVWLDFVTTLFNLQLCDVRAFHNFNDGIFCSFLKFDDQVILMFMIVIKVAGWLVSAMVVDGMFIKLTKVQYWFLIMTHGKTIVVNMILQMFCNYNIHGIVIKKIDQKTIIEMPSSFHPYWITNNVFIVMCITFT
jgi:hypothetical protein